MSTRIEQKVESITERIEKLKSHNFASHDNASDAAQLLDTAISSLEEFLEIVENDEEEGKEDTVDRSEYP